MTTTLPVATGVSRSGLMTPVFPSWAEPHYRCLHLMSHGAFATVWLVRSTSTGVVSVFKEILDPTPGTPRLLTLGALPREAELLVAQDHPFILHIIELKVDKSTASLGMVTEFCDRGDLHNFLTDLRRRGEKLDRPQLLLWFVQLCLGVAHLHRQRVLHRDIKTSNVFIASDNSIRLGDFGLARALANEHDAVVSRVGSPFYLSPEICRNDPYGVESDVWSLGCVLYEMVTLSRAFFADSMPAVVERICSCSYTPPEAGTCSDGVRELIVSMLQLKPEDRPSVQQVLQHPTLRTSVAQLEPPNPPAELRQRLDDDSPEVEAMRRAIAEASSMRGRRQSEPEPSDTLPRRLSMLAERGLSFLGIASPFGKGSPPPVSPPAPTAAAVAAPAVHIIPAAASPPPDGDASSVGRLAAAEATAGLGELKAALTARLGNTLDETLAALRATCASGSDISASASHASQLELARKLLGAGVQDDELASAVVCLAIWTDAVETGTPHQAPTQVNLSPSAAAWDESSWDA